MGPPPRDLNASRPAPIKIHRDSHTIKKPSSSAGYQPVIIYTHSPKVIHAQPRDFMALVQKLTGLSHAKDDDDNHRKDSESPSSSSENSGVTDAHIGQPLGFDPMGPSAFLPEIPLFAPDFLSSFYGYADPNAGSPLFIDGMRAFPDF